MDRQGACGSGEICSNSVVGLAGDVALAAADGFGLIELLCDPSLDLGPGPARSGPLDRPPYPSGSLLSSWPPTRPGSSGRHRAWTATGEASTARLQVKRVTARLSRAVDDPPPLPQSSAWWSHRPAQRAKPPGTGLCRERSDLEL